MEENFKFVIKPVTEIEEKKFLISLYQQQYDKFKLDKPISISWQDYLQDPSTRICYLDFGSYKIYLGFYMLETIVEDINVSLHGLINNSKELLSGIDPIKIYYFLQKEKIIVKMIKEIFSETKAKTINCYLPSFLVVERLSKNQKTQRRNKRLPAEKFKAIDRLLRFNGFYRLSDPETFAVMKDNKIYASYTYQINRKFFFDNLDKLPFKTIKKIGR